MEKFVCDVNKNFIRFTDFSECASCGNHICIKAAKKFNFICPNCFGRLFRIN